MIIFLRKYLLVLLLFSLCFITFAENDKDISLNIHFNNFTTERWVVTSDTVFSPIVTNFSLGASSNIPLVNKFWIFPSFTFYSNFYTYDEENDKGVITDIENRTANVFSLLLDLPVIYQVSLKKTQINLGLGLSIYARHGIRWQGVPKSEESNILKLNRSFWRNFDFLNLLAIIGIDFKLKNNFKFGFEYKFYFPISNFITEDNDKTNCFALKIGFPISFIKKSGSPTSTENTEPIVQPNLSEVSAQTITTIMP